MAKPDIKIETLGPWNDYVEQSPQDALGRIYEHAKNMSKISRNWYWDRIKRKRSSSLAARIVSFLLFACGAMLPLFAGLSDESQTRLQCTQFGVAALACAGILQTADRVFGWSSGWLRYVTTGTAMENLTRKFELDWADHMISKASPLDDSDTKLLFDLAKHLEEDIAKLQSDETDKWAAEFTTSMAQLGDLIKSQRESTDKMLEIAAKAAAAKEIENQAKDKAQQPGAINVTLLHKDAAVTVNLSVDGSPLESFAGTNWTQANVLPGQHTVEVTTTGSPAQTYKRTVLVPPGGITEVEIKLA